MQEIETYITRRVLARRTKDGTLEPQVHEKKYINYDAAKHAADAIIADIDPNNMMSAGSFLTQGDVFVMRVEIVKCTTKIEDPEKIFDLSDYMKTGQEGNVTFSEDAKEALEESEFGEEAAKRQAKMKKEQDALEEKDA